MDQYTKIEISVDNEAIREILIAELSEIGYTGFEESDTSLNAYIEADSYSQPALDAVVSKYQLTYSKSTIEKQNWNALWESNFEPVQVGDFVAVRAGFHPKVEGVKHEIIITPKMSFGTGHHGTTYSVMQLMESIDFQGKSVFDFGTGTGILAILAEKLGATEILAVDNDPWCIENASENSLINRCNNINIQLLDTADTHQQYDVVIANINKNIILDNLALLGKAVKYGGDILLSGLLVMDESDILTACKTLGWKHQRTLTKEGWIAVHLKN